MLLTTFNAHLRAEDGVQTALHRGDTRALRKALAFALGVDMYEAMKVHLHGTSVVTATGNPPTNTVDMDLSGINSDTTIACPLQHCDVTCTARDKSQISA